MPAETARIEALLDGLGDPSLSLEAKEEIEKRILAEGKPAIPVLIAHRADGRIYEKGRDVTNRIGLAVDSPPPPAVYQDITVGSECAMLLDRMVTPAYRSPLEPQAPVKPRGPFFEVPDWEGWWQRNKAKPLATIHEEMKAVIDRYWAAGGKTQVVR